MYLAALTGLSLLLSSIYLYWAFPVPFKFISISSPSSPSEWAARGRWETAVKTPIVAVAAAPLVATGRILLWSADRAATFGEGNRTLWAVFDTATGHVSEAITSSIEHNMFCPGLSLDSEGNVFVTGGQSSIDTSLFLSGLEDGWVAGTPLTTGRGYHAQTILSDGRTFTIGGSWAGGLGGKDGEVFDPATGSWRRLPGCPVDPLVTDDELGIFAADNHAWLFAWKNGSVFQAGPSRRMNWYGTHGVGNHSSSKLRGTDSDAMNGNAVMFDAVEGKILTLGGAHNYHHALSTANAHLITLPTTASGEVTIEELPSMHFPRAYANSVVLPTGDVFINGGASYALQWTDANASLVPELWSPQTREFLPMAKSDIARTYHSFAILLPDATVLTGGGGLCWEQCDTLPYWEEGSNHFNIQVFTPPYLFDMTSRGGRARRPKILSISQEAVLPGTFVLVATNVEIEEASMIRYGSATHSINTDQRRVPLTPVLLGSDTLKEEKEIYPAGKMARPVTRTWTYQVGLPQDPGILLPGYWMLFVMRDGVPSIAETIRVEIVSRST